MYVRVTSGGHLFLIFTFLINGSYPASGADLVTLDVPVPPNVEKAPLLLEFSPHFSGFVELNSALGKAHFEEDTAKTSGWGLRGVANLPIGERFNIQLDGRFENLKFEDLTDQSIEFGAHTYYRNPDRFALGLYGQYERISSETLALGPKEIAVGLEGAVFLSQSTVLGQIGVEAAQLEGEDASKLNGLIGARYYQTDNLRFDLDAGFERLVNEDTVRKTYSISTAANYRLSDKPITAFGGYRFRSSSMTSGDVPAGDTTSHGIVAGFRYHFGSTSLKDEERNGPLWTAAPYLDF
ncbi:hypothetical protein ACFPOD_02380 [Nitratireductor kimnyeongensis]|uniref:Uncharacterized protein n=1 Tax=Nitratireductor kimnyeongensis TaxID=430679 RepID=A0ABW0T494_9HYPH|nr:hypothetical protein [Nitratireductor kimnyeongensis]QZZ35036.1 hypothetical protein KW403_14810 [Nitratireductor kimnyeongensis]